MTLLIIAGGFFLGCLVSYLVLVLVVNYGGSYLDYD